MKKLLVLSVITIMLGNVCAQKIATRKIKHDPFISFNNFILLQNGDRSFIISRYKTTNLEYLCYLEWLYRVFSTDYPEVYKAALPDTTKYPAIFDPSKAGDPVKGISEKQAQDFCSWRTDRLNEYILIREGILKKDYSESNEDNFNTESYLCHQYEGLIKNDLVDIDNKGVRKVIYNDFFLLPGSYPATKDELRVCDSLYKAKGIEPKKKIISDLDWWLQSMLEVLEPGKNRSPLNIYKSRLPEFTLSGKKKIKNFIGLYEKKLAKASAGFDVDNTLVSSRNLMKDNLRNFKKDMRYYSLLPDSLPNPFSSSSYSKVEAKDSLGRMNFIYIADNSDGTPVLINRNFFNRCSSSVSDAGFYCAMNVPYRIYMEFQKFLLRSYTTTLYYY
jgi:hypothetical protein